MPRVLRWQAFCKALALLRTLRKDTLYEADCLVERLAREPELLRIRLVQHRVSFLNRSVRYGHSTGQVELGPLGVKHNPTPLSAATVS